MSEWNFCDVFPCGDKPPSKPKKGPPPDKPYIDEFMNFLIRQQKKGEVRIEDIDRGLDFLKVNGYPELVEVMYRFSFDFAKNTGEVSPLKLASLMVDYARMLDKQADRQQEANMLTSLALLSLHNRGR